MGLETAQLVMRTPAPARLGPGMRALEALVGRAGALALIHVWGGGRVYVPLPGNLHDDHPLVAALGWGLARTLAERYGGGVLEVPRGAVYTRWLRDRELRARLRAGEALEALAAEYGLCERQLRNIAAGRSGGDEPGGGNVAT